MNRRIALAVLAAVVITGIWYVALWSPQSKSLKKANARTAAAQVQQNTLRGDITVLKREQTELPAKQAELVKLKQALPEVPSLDTLIDNINTAALGSGVDWQSIAPTKPASYNAAQAASVLPGVTQAVPVSMQANGSYSQLLDFVNRLNAMPRLLTVSGFSISGVGGATKTSAQITSQVFYVPALASAQATTPTTVGH